MVLGGAYDSLEHFNDSPETTHDDVRATFAIPISFVQLEAIGGVYEVLKVG